MNLFTFFSVLENIGPDEENAREKKHTAGILSDTCNNVLRVVSGENK